jgi:hypothetical protein
VLPIIGKRGAALKMIQTQSWKRQPQIPDRNSLSLKFLKNTLHKNSNNINTDSYTIFISSSKIHHITYLYPYIISFHRTIIHRKFTKSNWNPPTYTNPNPAHTNLGRNEIDGSKEKKNSIRILSTATNLHNNHNTQSHEQNQTGSDEFQWQRWSKSGESRSGMMKV